MNNFQRRNLIAEIATETWTSSGSAAVRQMVSIDGLLSHSTPPRFLYQISFVIAAMSSTFSMFHSASLAALASTPRIL